MECPYCKYENRDGVRYCSNCGRALSPTTATITSTGGTSRSLAIGTPLQAGRYVVTKILGEGGMGAALLATDKRTDNKLVVIKELVSDNTDPAKFQEDVRNFTREVATLAHLDHPLISYVTDSFEENSRYFMVQKYIEGENLEERLDRVNQPMKEREVLGLASEVLDILDYLALQTPPIVHRDIKPANIIIGSKGKRAHLVDFGIARADEAKNIKRKQTSALGTPGYAPPEQYQGNADPRSDLYALGATMHHLLTNRDPRNYPPFTYPPVRTLNPQVSSETEHLITKAVNNDITQRYQSAMAMKSDVDDILLNRFGVSGNTGSYTLGTSGPMVAAGAASTVPYANPAMYANQPTQVQQPPLTPVPPPPPYQQGSMYSQPPRRQGGTNVGRNFLLFMIAIVLLGLLAYVLVNFLTTRGSSSNGNATPTVAVPSNGIGVTKAQNGETIGISDGNAAFDTSFGRQNGDLKKQAALKFAVGDTSGAVTLWNQAVQKDTSDAESLIYLENQHVIDSGNPYITIVVGTMLTGNGATASVGRDNLQGAYVAQKSFNDVNKLNNSVLIRLLIANAGSSAADTKGVAQQIVQLAQVDKHFVGVMGWPFSGYASIAISVLRPAHIPMISQTASSDALTARSPYFFRVAPTNQRQGFEGAKYAEQTLHATKAVIFEDRNNLYTQSLANAFSTQFTADGNQIVATETYAVGKTTNFPQLISDAATHNPDLIYFAGYANDASVLLKDLPTTGSLATAPIMGGDALYEIGGYGTSLHATASRLNFTSFAYPDEWKFLCNQGQSFACSTPSFFDNYKTYYDPKNQHSPGAYGFQRADGDTILSYDATVAMLTAANNALTGAKTTITTHDMLLGIQAINRTNALQGVSGQIAFGSDSNPINKSLVILRVVNGGFFTLVSVQPCFPKGQC